MDDLGRLQDEFPTYQIWRETARGEVRYVARRQRQGPGPHTLVTSDIKELRATLLSARSAHLTPVPAIERQAE